MGILDNLKKAASALVGNTKEPTTDNMIRASVLPYEAIPEQRLPQDVANQLLQRYSGTAAVCVDRITQAVASCPIKLMRRARSGKAVSARRLESMKRYSGVNFRRSLNVEDQLEEVTDENHPFLALMRRCWPGGNLFELMETTQGHLCLTGNAYWVKIRNGQKYPVEVWPANPADIRVVKDRETFISGYIYGREQSIETRYGRNDVVHFKNPNFQSDPYYGRGDIEKCLLECDMARMIVQHGMATLQNGATPGMIVMPTEGKSWAAAVRDQIAADLRRKYSGTDKSGKTMVLSDRVEIKEPQQYARELSYLVSSDQMRDKICNTFGVPVAMLTLDTAALANAKEAMPQFYTFAVTPRLNRLADTINDQLLPEFREALGDDSLIVAFDSPNHDEQIEKIGALVAASGGPIYTRNEARAEMGKAPVAGGDEFPKAADPFGGLLGRGSPPGENGGNSEPPKPSNDLKDDALGKSAGGEWFRPASSGCCAVHPRTPLAKAGAKDAAAFIRKQEVRLIQAIVAWLELVFSTIDPEDAARRGYVTIGGNPQGMTWGELSDAFANVTAQPLSDLTLFGFNLGRSEAPVPAPTFAEITAPAAASLRRYQLELADEVMQSAEAAVRQALATSIQTGQGIRADIQAVRDVLTAAPAYAAERIAQTESVRAFCNSREEGWKSTEQIKGKEWLLSGNPCKLCKGLKGRVVPIGQPFAVAGDTIGGVTIKRNIDNPPGHPNCRCDIGAVWKEENE